MQPFRMKTLPVAIAAALLIGCAAQPISQEEGGAQAVEGYIEDVNKLNVVDCLLPGQIRKLGSQVTYLSARRPVRTTEADCEVRGGEYVAYDRANYASALKVWLPKAEEGDATAQLYVGQIYEKGLGQPADYQAAAKWYRKAAEQGNAQAQINLGALYEKGLGVGKDSRAAAQWYGKATGLQGAGLEFAAAPIADTERKELESLRQTAARSRQEAEGLRAELAAAERRRREAETRAARTGQSSAELEALRRSAEESRQEAERLRAELRSQESGQGNAAELAALRQSAERSQQEAERLKARLHEAEAGRQEAERLRAELAATRQQLMDQEDDLRKAQDEMEKLRDQLQREKAASPAADDPRIRELEQALRQKEATLKAQQSKVNRMAASFDQERKKLKQELASAKATPAPAAKAAVPAADPAREQLAATENELHARMDEYRRGSAELTALLTRGGDAAKAEVETRKAGLRAQALEISALKDKVERQTAKLKEQQGPIQLAEAGPEIEIITPEMTLTRGVRVIQVSPGTREIVGKIKAPDTLRDLLVNQQPVATDTQGLFRFPVKVQGESTPVQITAIDKKNQTTRLDVSLMATTAAAAPEPAAAPAKPGGIERPGDVRFGKFYALIIGNNTYTAAGTYANLQTPANDAKSLDVVLRERYGFTTKLLLNATRHQIMTALNELHKRMTAEDNLLIYYAGHGEIDEKTRMAYWLPTDAEAGNPANWISSQSITEFISIMPARHVMVVADSCYSGALTGSAVAKLPEGMDESKREKWLKIMNGRKARTVLTSGGVKPVLDQGGGGHSVFANAFLGVLRSNQRVLEDFGVFSAVVGQVQAASARAGLEQTPQYAPLQHAGHEGSPFFFVPEKS
jgi:hypothetical protein